MVTADIVVEGKDTFTYLGFLSEVLRLLVIQHLVSLQMDLSFAFFSLQRNIFEVLWFLVAHPLELSHYLLELIQGPVVKVFTIRFRLDDVLLKLLRIIVFLDDLLEQVSLLLTGAIIHCCVPKE